MISAEIINSLISLQQSAVATGNPPFSAIIIADGNIISACHNVSRSSGNPLEHAEMSAIQSAVKNHGSAILKNAHLISSNEPCPMCIGACIWSGISEVTYFISQEQVEAVRGWGRFMPARSIAEADDSGIVVNGPVENEIMLQMHRDFWSSGANSAFKHSIHLSNN
ncbi:MAG: nucleoside deaminase [Spirochaetes bacterium]|nr:nucleoside deaminase [Spirochaetota bacterium]